MVTTRKHPAEFPEPTSPSSPSPDGSLRGSRLTSPSPSTTVARRSTNHVWSHTPSNLTLLWLAISLPLVIWDTGYILGRPYTMPGGSLHSPLYKPYALYGTIDFVYGLPAFTKKEGFSNAQGFMNAIETMGYLGYLYLVYTYGHDAPAVKGRGVPKKVKDQASADWLQKLTRARVVGGKEGAGAVLLLFTMAVMTVSKTMLYWLRDYYSGWQDIGHNDFWTLLPLWIIPNGAWLVVPSYLIYVSAQEILQGLAIAGGDKKRA